MKRKRTQFMVLCVVVLLILYILSLGICLSYKAAIKREVRQAIDIPSTDLSGLSFNGYKVGEEISIVPYEGWEDEKIPSILLIFEDGARIRLWDIYYIGGIANSRLDGILIANFKNNVTAVYNDKAIANLMQLQDFLGDSYIESPPSGGANRLITYIDHKNNLTLALETNASGSEIFSVYIEKFDLDDYVNYEPGSNASVWIRGSNPFFVTPRVLAKLDYSFTIFRIRNNGFTNSEILILPFYYFILFLPVLALIIFRSKKLLYLNGALAAFYILWSIGTAMYYAQF